ncbi:acyltransferase family protein [Amycolatopsis sp. CA-230715]|uniref:acyltransferase family protein n=1 Tax=Amycolatopsis sp. CA-230715 TaxID=2745196 RepID=UPI001C010AE8|nr:acyltransferase [Amycolatopsis sp. CA-230715]QWF77845.1 hypothetical protein HUW46_01238 [Amycolatopsis sp. CA-230715]
MNTGQGGKFEIEGYRAVAALVIVFFHGYQHNRYGPESRWPLQGTVWHEVLMNTDLLVDLFFVLSGFLLGLPYARAALGVGSPKRARAFLIRRAVRVFPLYVLVVLTVWAISNPVLPGDWRDLLLHLTMTHVWSDAKIFYTDGPAWTLGIEVHFYLLLALLGALAQSVCRRVPGRGARLWILTGGIGALIAISLGYKLWAVFVRRYPADAWSIWFNPPAKLDVFAIGLLLAVAAAAGVRWPNRSARTAVGALGIGVVGAGIWCRYQGMPDAFAHSAFAVGLTLLIGATALSRAAGPRWLRWRPLVAISLVSYSIYLWHEPLLRVLDSAGLLPHPGTPWAFPVTSSLLLLVAVPAGFLSYHAIERTGEKIGAAFDRDGRPRNYYEPLPPPAN